MTGEHLTERDTEAIRLYVEEGLTLKEVGARLGVSPSTVWGVLQKAAVTRRRANVTERNDEIARLYAEGDLTLKEIGERFSLSKERVRQIATRAGVPRKKGGRTPRGGRRYALVPRDMWKYKQEIIHLYVDKRLSLKEIGERFGRSHVAIIHLLEAADIRRRVRGWRSGWPWRDSTQRTEEITHAYLGDRLTLRQVAARFDLSPECVRQILIRAGVPRRPAGRRAVGQETVE